jgi:hypothetical protein
MGQQEQEKWPSKFSLHFWLTHSHCKPQFLSLSVDRRTFGLLGSGAARGPVTRIEPRGKRLNSSRLLYSTLSINYDIHRVDLTAADAKPERFLSSTRYYSDPSSQRRLRLAVPFARCVALCPTSVALRLPHDSISHHTESQVRQARLRVGAGTCLAPRDFRRPRLQLRRGNRMFIS